MRSNPAGRIEVSILKNDDVASRGREPPPECCTLAAILVLKEHRHALVGKVSGDPGSRA